MVSDFLAVGTAPRPPPFPYSSGFVLIFDLREGLSTPSFQECQLRTIPPSRNPILLIFSNFAVFTTYRGLIWLRLTYQAAITRRSTHGRSNLPDPC